MRLAIVKSGTGVKAAANCELAMRIRLPALLKVTFDSMSATTTGLAPLASHATSRVAETRFCPAARRRSWMA